MATPKNLFTADDVLIKTGYYLLLLLLIAAFIAWGVIKAQPVEQAPSIDWRVIPVFVLAFIIPVVFLAAGYSIRSKEKQYFAVWNILERTLEVHIGDLVENTGLTRETIEKAIKEINRRGSAFFVYDRPSGWIVDGRLKSQTVAINTCPSCGHTMGYTLPLAVTKLPRCQYCRTELDATYVNRLKQEKIRFLLGTDSSSKPADTMPTFKGSGFNWAVFILLLVLFWPGALVYAYLKNGTKQ
jgi:hypothetical protein